MKSNIKIIEVARHRNGVMGAPFYVILFKDKEWPTYTFVASVFDNDKNHEQYRVSVLAIEELVKGNIKFAEGNSWRGDEYESDLREAIQEYEDSRWQENIEQAEKEFRDRLARDN